MYLSFMSVTQTVFKILFTTLIVISNEILNCLTFNLLTSKSRGYQCTKFVVSPTNGFKTLINATTKNIRAKRLIYGPSDHLFCKIKMSKTMIWQIKDNAFS